MAPITPIQLACRRCCYLDHTQRRVGPLRAAERMGRSIRRKPRSNILQSLVVAESKRYPARSIFKDLIEAGCVR